MRKVAGEKKKMLKNIKDRTEIVFRKSYLDRVNLRNRGKNFDGRTEVS